MIERREVIMSSRSRIPRSIRRFVAPTTAVMLFASLVGFGTSVTASAASSGTKSAFVRVNQVGYPSSAPKRAYLMASAAETGAKFSVKNSSGSTVFSGSIGANLGKWSTAYPDVYALDFDSVATAGTYTISVSSPIAATSPKFTIDTGANLYKTALANAAYFYQNERDGANYIATPLRTAPGHLNDAHAMTYLTPSANSSGSFSGDLSPLGVTVDASGGWWDAGDYLKFLETESYTVDLMLNGVRDFGSQLGTPMANEATFGTQWLLKMWDDPSKTLYYQVGIGEGNAKTVGDHDIWRLPQADDTYGGSDPTDRYIRNRPVFRAGTPGSLISPNLAGRDAAAFAECFQVYKTSNPTMANQCLTDAEHIFDLANTNPGQLLTVIPYSFYPETEWRDDLELGATELYKAVALGGLPSGLPHTTASYYLQQAAHWANAYITGPNDAADTLNLYDVSGLAHFDLYKAITAAGNPAGLEVTQASLLADIKKQLDKGVSQAGTDPFQFGFTWAAWDTTTHGAGLAVLASEYDQLAGSTAYSTWMSRWMANILGANAWGTSLIVGDGTTFPHCMQHQVANLVGSTDGSAPILAGAVVEGPNGTVYKGTVSGMVTCPPNGVDTFAQFNGGKGAQYKDDVQSFSTVEPAIDLSSSSFLAFARTAAGLG